MISDFSAHSSRCFSLLVSEKQFAVCSSGACFDQPFTNGFHAPTPASLDLQSNWNLPSTMNNNTSQQNLHLSAQVSINPHPTDIEMQQASHHLAAKVLPESAVEHQRSIMLEEGYDNMLAETMVAAYHGS